MPDSKYVLPDPETITVSGDAARRLIGSGSGDAALLYLYILQCGGVFTPSDAAAKIGRSDAQIGTAMAVLARLGLVNAPESPETEAAAPMTRDELPPYSPEEIRRGMEGAPAFAALVSEVEKALCRILTADDLEKLFGIYDHLGLPPEVILLLVNHCIAEHSRRYSTNTRPTLRYIERAAYTWEREGIFSLEAAEEYLKRYAHLRDETAAMAEAMQISGRALSATERKYIASWIAMGFKPDAAAEAFDRTVTNTGKLAWKYMDSIMRSWHGKGLHTAGEIRRGDGRSRPAPENAALPAKPRKNAPTDGAAPTVSELERMRRTLQKLREEE